MPYRIHVALQSAGITDTVGWLRDSAAHNPEFLPKALFAGLFVLLGAFAEGMGSVAFWGLTVFWIADMVGGTARALDRGDGWDAGKALSGILRYAVVMGAWAVTLTAQEMAREGSGFEGSGDWLIVAAGAGVFLGSFAGQVGYFVPPVGKALDTVTRRVFGGKERGSQDDD